MVKQTIIRPVTGKLKRKIKTATRGEVSDL
jgi:hypothetical protein